MVLLLGSESPRVSEPVGTEHGEAIEPSESAPAASPINAVIGDASWVARNGERPGPDATEVERIRTHLAFVEELLRESDVSHLTPIQRANRWRALGALARYRRAGVFPQRSGDAHEGRHPRFIDDRGVHCAVGEMIAATGHPGLAAAIDREHEFAVVLELDSAPLLAWADEYGFSVLELAMIQPGYQPPPDASSMRGMIESSIERRTLECAARHVPVRRLRLRVRGDRDGRAHVRSISRNGFVRCFVDGLDGIEPGGAGAFDRSPSPYRFRMAIPVEPPQAILERRFEAIDVQGEATSCIPRPGALPQTAAFELRVGTEGIGVDVRTTPSNPEVDRCLAEYVQHRLAGFVGGRWSLALQEVRELGARVGEPSLGRALDGIAPSVATQCYEADGPARASVTVRAVRDAPAFEVEVEGGGPTFAECVSRGIGERLEGQFTVSRALSDGSHERFFRIDGDAEASHAFEVETPQARDERIERMHREMDRHMQPSI